MLSKDQQSEFLALLARGASPAIACRELKIEQAEFLETMRGDDDFFTRICDVQEMLTRNVSAALYKAALEGKVSAQTFYLRHYAKPAQPHNDMDDDLLDDMPVEHLKRMLLAELPDDDDDAIPPDEGSIA